MDGMAATVVFICKSIFHRVDSPPSYGRSRLVRGLADGVSIPKGLWVQGSMPVVLAAIHAGADDACEDFALLNSIRQSEGRWLAEFCRRGLPSEVLFSCCGLRRCFMSKSQACGSRHVALVSGVALEMLC